MATREPDPDSMEQSIRRRRMGRRRQFILGYWLLQSGVAYVAVPLLQATSWSEVAHLGSDLIDFSYIMYGVSVIALITMLQWVFVIPVRPPRKRGRARARVPFWTKLMLAASVATPLGILGVGVSIFWETYDRLPDPYGISMLEPPEAFWICWLIGLAPAIPIVAWLCKRELPPLISACVAGCITGLLVFAAVMGGASLVGLIWPIETPTWARAVMVLGPFMLGWVVSTPLLLAFIRKHDTETALKKLSSLLFLGTAVELLAVIPVDVFVRRKSSCYCAEGSYLALITLIPLGFVTLGPMIFLVAATKRRQRWLHGQCEICGYDMSGLIHADRCPECGAGWKTPHQEAARTEET